MSETEQISRFGQELKKLISHFCEKHEVTYAAMVGALVITAIDLANDLARDQAEQEDQD